MLKEGTFYKSLRDCKGQITFAARWFAPSFSYPLVRRLDYNITCDDKYGNAYLFKKDKSRRYIKSYTKKKYIENEGDNVVIKGNNYVINKMRTYVEDKVKLIRSRMLVYPTDEKGERIIEHVVYKIPRIRNPELYKRGERRPLRKSVHNMTRSRKVCRNLILTNFTKDTVMLTVTYAENMTSLSLSKKDINKFFKRLRYSLGIDIKYVWVAERQRRGAIHFHVMVFNWPRNLNLDMTENEYVASIWKKGFCMVTRNIKNKLYIVKYINKSDDFLDDVNERIFSSSKGLPRTIPKEYHGIHYPISNSELIIRREFKYGIYSMYKTGGTLND